MFERIGAVWSSVREHGGIVQVPGGGVVDYRVLMFDINKPIDDC